MAEQNENPLWVEISATVLIGLATVLGAYSAYQSALWGGNCLASYNEGVATLSEANTEEMKGVQTYTFDMLTWMQFKIQTRAAEREADVLDGGTVEINYPQRMATQIRKQMMEERLRRAMAWSDFINKKIEEKIEKLPVDADGDIEEKAWDGMKKELNTMIAKLKVEASADIYKKKPAAAPAAATPGAADDEEDEDALDFAAPQDAPEYTNSLYSNAKDLKQKARKAMEEGTKANQTGDRFTLMTVLFTIVLFFAGVCIPIKNDFLQRGFLVVSTALLLLATVMLFRLPLA
jgi:hypothetical protein